MAVYRVQRTRDYTVMSNYHLKDKGLTLKSMIKIHFFCSAEEKTAGSRPFCGKAMVSFSCTKGWITVLSGGQGRQMKQWPSQMTSTGC